LKSGEYVLVDKYGTKFTQDEQKHAIEEKHHLHYPVVPARGHTVVDFSITRQLLFVFFTALVLLLLGLRTASKYKKGIGVDSAPKGKFQNAMESLVMYIRDNVAVPSLGDKADKYLPYLISVFLFIVLGNLLGLIPFGVTATSNISVTAALAVITFLLSVFGASKDYWRHIFNPPGMNIGVKVILVPIEFIGMFIKPFALAFRLFGNMVSGHLVIISIIGMTFIFGAKLGHGWGWGTSPLWYLLTVGIYLLKIMVSVIQAYVFTMLSALFIGMAVEEHDHHDDHAHADHGHLEGHTEPAHADLTPALATA